MSEVSPPDSRRWLALCVCLSASFMSLLDVNVVNVALPAIRAGTGASDAQLQWIVAGYALALGILLVPSGRLGDALGRRRLFVLGVGAFTFGSIMCAVAPTAEVLVVTRLLQGAGAGVMNPQISGFIQEAFRGHERGVAFGVQGAVIGISSALGPFVGGVIVDGIDFPDSWRYVFFVNVPVGLVTAVLGHRLLPSPARVRREGSGLDLVGAALLGAAVLSVLIPIMARTDVPALWFLPLAGVASVLLLRRWESAYAARGLLPILDRGTLNLPGYRSGVLVALALFSGATGTFFVLTLHLQTVLGRSALETGVILSPVAVGAAIASVLGGRAVHVRGLRVVRWGLALVSIGTAVTGAVLVLRPGSVWWLVVPLLVSGLGNGLVVSPNQAMTLACVPPERGGAAAALLQMAQRVGAAMGIAGIGAVYFILVDTAPSLAVGGATLLATVLLAGGLLAVQQRRLR